MDGLAPTDRGSQLTAAQVLARLNANATIALTAPVTMASTLGVTGATTLNNTLTVNSTAVALANASAGGTLFSVTNNDTTSATQIEFKLIGTTSSSGRPAARLFYSPNTSSSSTFLLQTGKVSGLLFEGNGATVINQRDAAPIVIGINDAEVGRWTSSALQSQQSIDVYGNGNARRIGFNFFGSDQWGFYTDGTVDAAKMTFRKGTTDYISIDASGNFSSSANITGALLTGSVASSTVSDTLKLINFGNQAVDRGTRATFYGPDSGSSRLLGSVAVAHQTGASLGAYMTLNVEGTGGAGTLVEAMRLTRAGSVIIGTQAALATTATAGFAYMPTCAGTPTGTPDAFTGKVPWVYDSTNNKIYVYNGAWKATAALT